MTLSTVVKDPVPPASVTLVAPQPPPVPGTVLITTLGWNNLLDILNGISTDTISVKDVAFQQQASGDATKILGYDLSQMTTGKKITIQPLSTITTIVKIPNTTATDTFAMLGVANVHTAQNTFSAVTNTSIVANPASGPTGSSSQFDATFVVPTGQTVAFQTSPQTGNFNVIRLGTVTMTNPSAGSISQAATIRIDGPPIAGANVTVTSAFYTLYSNGTLYSIYLQAQGFSTTSFNAFTMTTGHVGSASEITTAIVTIAGTTTFLTTAQTGDVLVWKIDLVTLANPSAGTITNAASLKIVGAPVAGSNTTITNAYALWVAAGQTTLGGALVVSGNAQFSAQFKAIGAIVLGVSTNTTTTTLGNTSRALQLCDATGGAFTVTLPAANLFAATFSQMLVILKKDSSANAITISRAGTDTISQGASTGLTTISLATIGKCAYLMSDGNAIWYDVSALFV